MTMKQMARFLVQIGTKKEKSAACWNLNVNLRVYWRVCVCVCVLIECLNPNVRLIVHLVLVHLVLYGLLPDGMVDFGWFVSYIELSGFLFLWSS